LRNKRRACAYKQLSSIKAALALQVKLNTPRNPAARVAAFTKGPKSTQAIKRSALRALFLAGEAYRRSVSLTEEKQSAAERFNLQLRRTLRVGVQTPAQ